MATELPQQQTESTALVARQEVHTPDLLTTISGQNAERDQLILLRAKLDYTQRMAKMFAYSGCFADIKDTREEVAIAKALVKIKLGESMGFSEAEAMTGIDIIQGRVAVGASLRAARMQRAGFSWPQMVCNDSGCWIPLVFKGEPMLQQKVSESGELVTDAHGKPVLTQVVVSFTHKDAQLASLANKDNYKKDPSSMYFARGITRAQRRYGPGVLGVDILDTYEARDIAPDVTYEANGRMIGKETVGQHASRLERQMAEQAEEDTPVVVATGPAQSEPKPKTMDAPAPGPVAVENKPKGIGPPWDNKKNMLTAFQMMRAQLEDAGDTKSYVRIVSAHSLDFEEMTVNTPEAAEAFNELQQAVRDADKGEGEPITDEPVAPTIQFTRPPRRG